MPDDYLKFPKLIPRVCQIRLQSDEINFGFVATSGIDNIGIYIQEVIPNSSAY
jgi:hypothetical protein